MLFIGNWDDLPRIKFEQSIPKPEKIDKIFRLKTCIDDLMSSLNMAYSIYIKPLIRLGKKGFFWVILFQFFKYLNSHC